MATTSVRPIQPRPRAKARVRGAGEDSDIQGNEEQDGSANRKRGSEKAELDNLESILDPKVMVPYITKVGGIPRRVQIERKRRQFEAEKIADLLVQEGLQPEAMQIGAETHKLPLHCFDNTDYETRYPSQWVDRLTKVPAQAAFVNFEGRCLWKKCVIIDYIEESNTYLVQWDDTGQTTWLPRVALVNFKDKSRAPVDVSRAVVGESSPASPTPVKLPFWNAHGFLYHKGNALNNFARDRILCGWLKLDKLAYNICQR